MRINWKKRLGVCGVLTLLCLTVVSGALATLAGAQVVTGQLGVKIIIDNGTGGSAHNTDFAYQINGGTATPFLLSGTNVEDLDVSGTYTTRGVPFTGFDFTYSSGCTDATVSPALPVSCRITAKFIEPPTTTTTTTTTTTLPATTTTGRPGQRTIHESATDSNRCLSHLTPKLQPDANLRIGVTLGSDASPQPHLGDPITLSNSSLGLNIPAGLIQAGVNLKLIKNGDQVPSDVTVGILGSNTVEGQRTLVIHATAIIHTVPVAVSKKTYPLGKKALPLNVTLPLPDTHWTPVSATKDVLFSEKSLVIVAHLHLPGLGPVTATFTCEPATSQAFVAIGATGEPVTTGPATTPTSSGSGTGPGATTGVAPAAAGQLPRTGSNPWPLLVLAAICIDLGLLAVAGAKRGRRLLHR